MTQTGNDLGFVMCIDNGGYPVSLEVRRIYRCKADAGAAERGLLRVIDETGDDYLYPKEMFEPVTMSATARSSRRRR